MWTANGMGNNSVISLAESCMRLWNFDFLIVISNRENDVDFTDWAAHGEPIDFVVSKTVYNLAHHLKMRQNDSRNILALSLINFSTSG